LDSPGRARQWRACAIDAGVLRIAAERDEAIENHRLAKSVFKKG